MKKAILPFTWSIVLASFICYSPGSFSQIPLTTDNGVKTNSTPYTGDLNTNQNWGGTGMNGMYIFNAQTLTNVPVQGSDWYHIIEMQHDNANNWTGQLALSYFTDGLFFRRQNTADWGSWHTVATQDWVNANTLSQNGGGITGNLGIGTNTPLAKLHVAGNGIDKDGGNNYVVNGDLVVQANTGGRLDNQGAQLEFVIPADTDGRNFWGQGRIITVAGNGGNGNATGKMIIGTRRSFDKKGTGPEWYYGDDITIDGVGNVGIGTLIPNEKLSVNGIVRSREVKVEATGWPDYVFQPQYKLPSLAEMEKYISQKGHLPNIPSAAEVGKSGIGLGEMNAKLLEKIEELTLLLIELDKRIGELEKKAHQ